MFVGLFVLPVSSYFVCDSLCLLGLYSLVICLRCLVDLLICGFCGCVLGFVGAWRLIILLLRVFCVWLVVVVWFCLFSLVTWFGLLFYDCFVVFLR